MAMARAVLLCALAGIAFGGPVLLNAGGPELPQIAWRKDTAKYASAGSNAFTGGGPNSATGTWAPVYESHRWAQTGNLQFKIPVPAGSYGMALMFAETWSDSGPGVRQMVVKINGAPVPQAGPGGLLDVFKKAGGLNKPVYLSVGQKASVGGFITVAIERVAGKNNPMISGIVILGKNADKLVGNEGLGGSGPGDGGPGKGDCPVAKTVTGRMGADGFVMNVGGPALPNINWGADNTNYIVEANKGIKAIAPAPVPVKGSWGPAYLTHRWTKAKSLTYKIPVPAGTYKVALLHAESFVSGVGKRTFGISINGDVKAAAYDVFAQAGLNRALFKQYPGIKSVGGFITISFTKVVENPFINGIYITGPGAGTIAIGGPEDGKCRGGPSPGPGDKTPFSSNFIKLTNGTTAKIERISVAIYGPDARLYLGAVDGKVHALTLNKLFQITKQCTTSFKDAVQRSVLGLAFNPKSNALKLHVSTSTLFWKDYKLISDFGTGWTNGKVETITMAGRNGCFNNDRKDLITGLPVSNHDSAVNGLEFLPSGELLISVGGFTNGGISIPGDLKGGIASNPLSGAVVSCPAEGTAMTYSNLNNPVKSKITGGACKTYATGLRSSFGMEYHTNGHLYATDNGPNKKFGEFSTNCVGGKKPDQTLPDKLFKVSPGKCHGYPNINRGECVFNDPKCVQPLIANLQSSTNGVLEYRSNTFQGKFKGNLFLSKYATHSGEGRLTRVQLNGQGNVAENGLTQVFFPKSGLSITEGPRGEMIMPRVQKGHVLVLTPSYKAPAKTAVISVMPRRGPSTGGTTVLVTGHNFGTTPTATFGGKACTNVLSIDSGTFTCVTPALVAAAQVKVVVSGSGGVSSHSGTDYWAF